MWPVRSACASRTVTYCAIGTPWGLVAGIVKLAGRCVGIVGHPVLLVVGLVPAAYLAYDWFTYRAKRGMRF